MLVAVMAPLSISGAVFVKLHRPGRKLMRIAIVGGHKVKGTGNGRI